MMTPFVLRAGAVVVALATIAGCASMRRMKPEEAIAARQQLMKEQGAAFKSINDKAKAGQFAAIEPDAKKLVETSKQIPKLFPEGSLDPKTSRAKPEIWQKRAEFEGYAKTLQTKATQLASTAKGGDAAATNAAVTDLGRTTCGACHNAFRGPEIKK
jgi:cytochrome c556